MSKKQKEYKTRIGSKVFTSNFDPNINLAKEAAGRNGSVSRLINDSGARPRTVTEDVYEENYIRTFGHK